MATDASTRHLTVAQAMIAFLRQQYVERDGASSRFSRACFGIFGHGNVAGIGQALEQAAAPTSATTRRATSRAWSTPRPPSPRRSNRLRTFACTTSIGPGATNMVTGAATATVNRLPVLLLPGDIFATPATSRRCCSSSSDRESQDVSVNDCFKPVSRYWDRINRPEQLLTALPEAMRVLTSPGRDGRGHARAAAGRAGRGVRFPGRVCSAKRVWHVPAHRARRRARWSGRRDADRAPASGRC